MVSNARTYLKSGPLSGLYLRLRNAKRRLLRQSTTGVLPVAARHAGPAELKAMLDGTPHPGRVLYSLGVRYLEAGEPHRAVACLRTADAVGFEGTERLRLHLARALAEAGQGSWARELARSLVGEPLMDSETRLLETLLRDTETASPRTKWRDGADVVAPVVLESDDARTALLTPDAPFILLSAEVTGLRREHLAGLNVAPAAAAAAVVATVPHTGRFSQRAALSTEGADEHA